MKITRTLEITTEEFYDHLEQGIIESIKKTSSKIIKKADIKKGLKYSTTEHDVYTKTSVKILDYQRGNHYKARINSIMDNIIIEYSTREVDKGLEVEFDQVIESFEKKKTNFLMREFSKAVYLGRMTDTLYDMQTKIHNQRNNIKETKIKKENKLLKHIQSKIKETV